MKPQAPVRLDPLPLRDAAAVVNANTARIEGTLRASGNVDGYVTDANGLKRHFDVDGVLFYLRPRYLRLDLKKFGERQLLLGSNVELYWVYDKQNDEYHCGRHGLDDGEAAAFPIRADQVLDALGLSWIGDRAADPGDGAGAEDVPEDAAGRHRAGRNYVQRVLEDHQELLFLARDEEGWSFIEKEYWLDRFAPRLIRRVIFRDADGVVEMESLLNDYRPMSPSGPFLPTSMTASWPEKGATMRFRIGKWESHLEVTPDGPQFAPPPQCDAPGFPGATSSRPG